jgi:DNA invertase Pin-like site-specific DNA recombinase
MFKIKMIEPKVAFGYVRSSTMEEVKQGSNERQKELITKYCEERGYKVQFFEDKGVSGKNAERPKLKEMKRKIEENAPSLIVVSKIDRYARSLMDLLKEMEYLQSKGIGFISVQDPGIDTTTANGKLLLQILGAFAEFERNLINSRTKAGREKAMEKGIKFGRPALKIKNGSFLERKRVLELKDRGMSARAISKVLGCSITPVLKIIKGG